MFLGQLEIKSRIVKNLITFPLFPLTHKFHLSSLVSLMHNGFPKSLLEEALSLNHLLCAQELPSIKSISLVFTTALWTKHFDSWAYWGSQSLTYLCKFAPQGSSTVGFKLRLVSLQSLLRGKGPSTCFYAILLLSKHFWMPLMSSTMISTGDLQQRWEIHSETLKGRTEVKQQSFHSSALNNGQSSCVHSTWRFTKCIIFAILVHLHNNPRKHIIFVSLSPCRKQYGT